MTPYEAVGFFKSQIERATGLKVVILPTPIKETVLAVKIAVRKVLTVKETQATKRSGTSYELRLSVSLEGTIESLSGLDAAVTACATLGSFLGTATRLEDADAVPAAASRITNRVSEDDAILEDPEGGKLAWVRDEHFVTIWIPE